MRQKILVMSAVMLALCITACGKGTQTDVEVEVNPEDAIEEREDTVIVEDEQEPEQESEREHEQSVPDNAIKAYLTENIEYADEVMPTQFVDDLSFLEDLKYTNGTYVYQDGKVYYRRYHEDSYEDTALWGAYANIPETKKEIVCINEDGGENVLFADEGYGDIYLINNRFYMTDGKLCEENGSTYTEKRLYSVDMQGNDRIDYGRGSIYAVDTERKIFILEMWEDGTVYYIMNYETGEKKPLLNGPVDYFYIDIQDYKDGWIYYEATDSCESGLTVSKLCAVSLEGEQKEIISIASDRDYREGILNAEVDDDRVYFIFGGYDGSSIYFQGGMIVSVNLDGTDYKAVSTEDDAFYLCHDGEKALVYFSKDYNRAYGGDDRPDEYDALVWDVEADICYRSNFPPSLLYYYNIITGKMWRYCSEDMGALCNIKISDDELQRKKVQVYAIPDDSGKIVSVVTDLEEYITKWEEEEVGHIEYKDFYFADGTLYFKAEYNVYDRETSIGWRDGYRRLHTDVYRLKIEVDKAEILYSY